VLKQKEFDLVYYFIMKLIRMLLKIKSVVTVVNRNLNPCCIDIISCISLMCVGIVKTVKHRGRKRRMI
jgi:hypothetical protein